MEVSDDRGPYQDYLQCSLTLRAAQRDKLMVQILRLDVELSYLCITDYLQIIDGKLFDNSSLDGNITYESIVNGGARCSSMVRAFAHGAMGSSDRSFMVDPLSYFSVQPVLHDWYNKGCGMCYPVCEIMHIK